MNNELREKLEIGMGCADRCQFCHGFWEKVAPYLCPDCAEKIRKLGYRKVPELKVLGEPEMSQIEPPSSPEVNAFRDNPANEFGETTLELKTIASYSILFAKKAVQAQRDYDQRQIEEANHD